jgi:hypothetical protein
VGVGRPPIALAKANLKTPTELAKWIRSSNITTPAEVAKIIKESKILTTAEDIGECLAKVGLNKADDFILACREAGLASSTEFGKALSQTKFSLREIAEGCVKFGMRPQEIGQVFFSAGYKQAAQLAEVCHGMKFTSGAQIGEFLSQMFKTPAEIGEVLNEINKLSKLKVGDFAQVMDKMNIRGLMAAEMLQKVSIGGDDIAALLIRAGVTDASEFRTALRLIGMPEGTPGFNAAFEFHTIHAANNAPAVARNVQPMSQANRTRGAIAALKADAAGLGDAAHLLKLDAAKHGKLEEAIWKAHEIKKKGAVWTKTEIAGKLKILMDEGGLTSEQAKYLVRNGWCGPELEQILKLTAANGGDAGKVLSLVCEAAAQDAKSLAEVVRAVKGIEGATATEIAQVASKLGFAKDGGADLVKALRAAGFAGDDIAVALAEAGMKLKGVIEALKAGGLEAGQVAKAVAFVEAKAATGTLRLSAEVAGSGFRPISGIGRFYANSWKQAGIVGRIGWATAGVIETGLFVLEAIQYKQVKEYTENLKKDLRKVFDQAGFKQKEGDEDTYIIGSQEVSMSVLDSQMDAQLRSTINAGASAGATMLVGPMLLMGPKGWIAAGVILTVKGIADGVSNTIKRSDDIDAIKKMPPWLIAMLGLKAVTGEDEEDISKTHFGDIFVGKEANFEFRKRVLFARFCKTMKEEDPQLWNKVTGGLGMPTVEQMNDFYEDFGKVVLPYFSRHLFLRCEKWNRETNFLNNISDASYGSFENLLIDRMPMKIVQESLEATLNVYDSHIMEKFYLAKRAQVRALKKEGKLTAQHQGEYDLVGSEIVYGKPLSEVAEQLDKNAVAGVPKTRVELMLEKSSAEGSVFHEDNHHLNRFGLNKKFGEKWMKLPRDVKAFPYDGLPKDVLGDSEVYDNLMALSALEGKKPSVLNVLNQLRMEMGKEPLDHGKPEKEMASELTKIALDYARMKTSPQFFLSKQGRLQGAKGNLIVASSKRYLRYNVSPDKRDITLPGDLSGVTPFKEEKKGGSLRGGLKLSKLSDQKESWFRILASPDKDNPELTAEEKKGMEAMTKQYGEFALDFSSLRFGPSTRTVLFQEMTLKNGTTIVLSARQYENGDLEMCADVPGVRTEKAGAIFSSASANSITFSEDECKNDAYLSIIVRSANALHAEALDKEKKATEDANRQQYLNRKVYEEKNDRLWTMRTDQSGKEPKQYFVALQMDRTVGRRTGFNFHRPDLTEDEKKTLTPEEQEKLKLQRRREWNEAQRMSQYGWMEKGAEYRNEDGKALPILSLDYYLPGQAPQRVRLGAIRGLSEKNTRMSAQSREIAIDFLASAESFSPNAQEESLKNILLLCPASSSRDRGALFVRLAEMTKSLRFPSLYAFNRQLIKELIDVNLLSERTNKDIQERMEKFTKDLKNTFDKGLSVFGRDNTDAIYENLDCLQLAVGSGQGVYFTFSKGYWQYKTPDDPPGVWKDVRDGFSIPEYEKRPELKQDMDDFKKKAEKLAELSR